MGPLRRVTGCDDAGAYMDVLRIINEMLGVRELRKRAFSLSARTYGLISFLLPLFLK